MTINREVKKKSENSLRSRLGRHKPLTLESQLLKVNPQRKAIAAKDFHQVNSKLHSMIKSKSEISQKSELKARLIPSEKQNLVFHLDRSLMNHQKSVLVNLWHSYDLQFVLIVAAIRLASDPAILNQHKNNLAANLSQIKFNNDN